MVPVKIECECGQHYAFEVEPVNGRMAHRVTCPICGLDGTEVANEKIAGALALAGPQPPAPPPPPPRFTVPLRSETAPPVPAPAPAPLMSAPTCSLHLAEEMHAPGHASTVEVTAPAIAKVPRSGTYSADQLGLVSREQAALEAKAKILWGEAQDSVIKYLMMQSYSYQEAADLVAGCYKARLADLRKKGMGKIIQGIGMICVPIVGWFLNMMMISFIIMGILAGIGVWGCYQLFMGIVMLVAPKTESGDVAED